MQQQDSSDPTGVAGTASGRNATGNAVTRARGRKANAAVELRMSGASWADIARILGYPTPRAALVATEKALEKNLDNVDREKMRGFASQRLERLLRGVWGKAIDPEAPDQLPAVGKAREILADHRKLWGLDAPSEVIVTSPSQKELDEWVARVVSQQTPDVEQFDVIEGEWTEDDDGPRAIPA